MTKEYYRISDFARKASVSVRTLRYYEQQGLLVPQQRDEQGYKTYSNEELKTLQYIVSLKYLDFSLKDIKLMLERMPEEMGDRLTYQKALLNGKKQQLEKMIDAIENIEEKAADGTYDYDSIVQAIAQAKQKLLPEWVNAYLTNEERRTMRDLAKSSYSKTALMKIASRGWTEQDQQESLSRYHLFRKALENCINNGESPTGEEGQKLARMLQEMNDRWTKGDPEIREGAKRSWEKLQTLPEEKKPKMYGPPYSEEERHFIKEAMGHLYRKELDNSQ